MGLRLFGSSSSYDKADPEPKVIVKTVNQTFLPVPNPENYVLKMIQQVGNHLVLMVNYPECLNYEGDKVLVYKNCTMQELRNQGSIDPHFSCNLHFKSPFARFEPTDEGYEAAVDLAERLP